MVLDFLNFKENFVIFVRGHVIKNLYYDWLRSVCYTNSEFELFIYNILSCGGDLHHFENGDNESRSQAAIVVCNDIEFDMRL